MASKNRRKNIERVVDEDAMEEDDMDVMDEGGNADRNRKLDLSSLKRKRLSSNTIIGVYDDGETVAALGVPTKKRKFLRLIFDSDGTAIKESKTMTEQEFTESYPNVYRMNKPVTLDLKGMVTPNRLSKDVSIVKESKGFDLQQDKDTEKSKEITSEFKFGKDTKTDEKPKEMKDPGTDEKTKDMDIDKEIEDPDTEDEPEPIRQEDKILEVTKETQEEIAELAHKEHPSDEPKEKEKVPEEDFSEKTLIKNYMSILQKQMASSKPDLAKKQFEELRSLAVILADFDKPKKKVDIAKETPLPDEMPDNLKRIENTDMEIIEEEKKVIEKVTEQEVENFEMEVESSDALLSKGEAVNTKIIDISTGHHNDMEIEQQLDEEHTDIDKGTTVAAKDRKDVPTPVDEDTEMADPNTENNDITLGADAETDRVDLPSAHSSSNTTSANKMEATIGPMEYEISGETKFLQEQHKKLGEEIKLGSKQFKDTLKTKRTFEQKVKDRQEKFRKEGDKEQEQRRKSILEHMQSGGDIQHFEKLMGSLQHQGIIEDAENVKTRRLVLATLRKENKLVDLRTAAAPTEQDILSAAVKEQQGVLGTGQLGGTGIGTPIFAPSTSRENLYELQRGVATLTQTEAIQIREELTPLWNEFKLGRIAAGVNEMERMPTRLLTSDLSTVKAASRLRSDMKQEEDTFGHFMYWLLHDRLDPTRHTTWRAFLTYAAALGYNDLTQTQINWMITGNENGDLNSNTIFSEVSEEEGDPLDVLLDIKGQKLSRGTVKALSAQVIGNPEPQAQYPSRNTSPSAAPVDNSIHPDGSTSSERQTRQTFSGVPSFIMNIPDPRFSRRGGIDVPNVRLHTRRNPNYDPTIQQHLKPGDEGHQEEYITEEVPDVGVGSKDIGAAIASAQSDRLLRAIPTKLYAPIHPQACDRYFGTLNYQRLSLPIERYMKSYSQHPWGPTDFQQMYNWNMYTMGLYGGMLYAFVNDVNMQKTSPIFDMNTPEAVGDEYMELNELINELSRFQQNADDRADRVTDSGAAQRPLEEQLDKFHRDQSVLDKEKMFQGDVAIISTEGLSPFPTGGSGATGVNPDDVLPPGAIPQPPGPVIPPGGGGPQWPGGGPDPRYDPDTPWSPNNDQRIDEDKPFSDDNDMTREHDWPDPPNTNNRLYNTFTSQLKSPTQIGATMMNKGISNKRKLGSMMKSDTVNTELERKNKMYSMFFRR